jgi:predicted alpha/beta hydrolase family esterase
MSLVMAQINNDFTPFKGEVLYSHTDSGLYEPVFHVYEQDGAIYIINRGTTDVCDFASDAEMEEINTSYGTFHSGFYKSALYVFQYTFPFIKGFTGPVYFVGHSMGGAVSTVLQILYASEIPNQDFNTIAFAPVPTADQALNQTYSDKIVIFVNNEDVVPTLSIPNMYYLLKKYDPLVDYSPRKVIIDLFEGIMAVVEEVTHVFTKEIYDALIRDFPDDIDALLDYGKGEVRTVRYPLGIVVGVSKSKSVPMDESIVDPIEDYSILRIKLTSFSDHQPENYEEAINRIPDDQ